MSTPTTTPVTYGRDASIARFSVARYQRMIDTGILTPDDRVELLENYLVLKMPHNPPHDGTIDLIKAAIGSKLPGGWLLRVQQTIVLPDSQPEPDLSIVRGHPRSYLTRHPGPADVSVLIEVADASLLRDQRDKTRLYARAGIACYWIANLVDGRIEVYSQPTGAVASPEYGSMQVYQPRDEIPLLLDSSLVGTLAVADLLP
jgi:Uma2 family endonuclease